MVIPNSPRLKTSPNRVVHISVAVFMLVVVALYIGHWFISANAVEGSIAAWAASQRARGMEVDYAGVEVTGFPFSHVATIARPRLADPNHPLAWSWEGGSLVITTRPWAFNEPRVTLPADQVLSYRSADGGTRRVTATLADGVADIVFADGGLATATITIDGLALSASEGQGSAERLVVTLRPQGEHDLDAVIDATAVRLPPAADPGFGQEIALLQADALLRGGLPAGIDAPAVETWSAGGGGVEVRRFALKWGDFGMSTKGTLGLDEALRPRGALDTEIVGHRALLDVLVGRGAVKKRDASLAASVLDLMAKSGENGARVIDLAVVAKDGVLNIGPIPLLKLKPLFSR